ncbi:MAG: hypothetical protein ABR552_07705 [Actinomycetota bacterium]
MRRFALAVVAVMAIGMTGAAAQASGDACASDGTPALGIVTVQTAAGTFYIDDRNFVLGNGTWVYQESNGIPGLQHGGSSPYLPDDTDPCSESGAPDTLIE